MKFVAKILSIATALICVAQSGLAQNRLDHMLSSISLPPGFQIKLFARVPDARFMVVGKPRNIVFVGSRSRYVHAVLDTDKDGVADVVKMKTDSLRTPNGVAFLDGSLYIATRTAVMKWLGPSATDINRRLAPLKPVLTRLPNSGHHGRRVISFGPDRKLYLSIGTPCNVCMPEGREGKIIRMDPDGKNVELVAEGIRNSVGFDWHPKTGELFFTDNGSDGLGDDIPADELNHVTRAGQHFGYPWFGGGDTRTPEFIDDTPPRDAVQPVVKFQAHTANLGIHFYRGGMFPAEYKNDAFVAQHGSWNRSSRVGYRIMRVRFNDKGSAIGKQVFASGWLQGEDVWGRPVDIKELPDGSLLVTDDFVGAVYRITYGG